MQERERERERKEEEEERKRERRSDDKMRGEKRGREKKISFPSICLREGEEKKLMREKRIDVSRNCEFVKRERERKKEIREGKFQERHSIIY